MKNNQIFRLALLMVIGSFLLSSCASVNNVATDYDVNTDFSRFTTYNFWDDVKQSENNQPEYDQLDERRIKEAVAKSLETKGYAYTDNNPDLLANVRIMVKTRRNATTFNPNFGYWRFGGANNININEYEEATIVVDLVDAQRNVLIWQGSIESPSVRNPEERDRKMKDAVMKMMLKFEQRAGRSNRSS